MDPASFEERRRDLRIPVKFILLTDISPNQDPNLIYEANLVNIAPSGALLQLLDYDISEYIKPLKEINRISSEHLSQKLQEYNVWLNFALPDNPDRIKIFARIIRATPEFQLALEFLDITGPDRKRIHDFISAVNHN